MIKKVALKRLLAMPITDGPHETPEFVESGVPFLSAESIKHGYLDFSLKRGYITREQHNDYIRKANPRRDDVFMVKSGATTGKVAIVETDQEFSIWSPLALMRAKRSLLSPKYLYYSLKSDYFQEQVRNSWSFGTQQNIGMQVIENLDIHQLELDQQQKIGDYLDKKTATIDSMLISKNHTHTQLSELRTAIIAQAMRHGYAAMNTEKVRLKTVANIYNGATPKSDNLELWDGDIAWATPVDLSKLDGKFIESTLRTITQAGYLSCNTRLIEPGNIVISNRAPIGLVAINSVPLCTNQGCKVIVVNQRKVNTTYLYYFLCSITADLNNLGSGTTFLEISSDTLKNIEMPLPSLKEQELIVNALDHKLEKLDKTNKTAINSVKLLEEYRASLISSVITGRVEL